MALWKTALQSLPVVLGHQVTPVPLETAYYLVLLGVSGAVLLLGLSHPIRSKSLLFLVACAIVACLVYAGLAIYSLQTGWKFAYAADAPFGFFANRNHTATFLVTGCLLSLGVLGVSQREGNWKYGVVAAVALAVGGTALLVFSASRGGVIFLCVGIFLWLAGLGSAHRTKSLVISFLAVFFAGVIFFCVSQGEARNRIFQMIDGAPAQKNHSGAQEVTLDGRILIFRDTWRMIQDHPWSGVGLGAFRYVYPFYQKDSLTDFTSVHPESDWLMLAAEAGIPAAIITIAALAMLITRAFSQRAHTYWALRWGVICAGLTAALHGIVDVPAHRMPLGWWILIVIAAGCQISPEKEARPFLWQRVVFWIAGLAALGMGVFLIRAEWYHGPASPPLASEKAGKRIAEMYQAKAGEAIIEYARQEILKSPMSDSLYYQKGVVLLNYAGTDNEVDTLFAIQRALNPGWSQIPLLQGRAWIGIDTARTTQLWEEALSRAGKVDLARRTGNASTLALWKVLLSDSQSAPDVQKRLLDAHRSNASMTLLWLEQAKSELTSSEMENIARSEIVSQFNADERRRFLRSWYEKGNRDALFAFADSHPDWENAIRPLRVRRLIDARDFQSAVELASKNDQVDLSLPEPGGKKNLSQPVDSDDPLANFDFYWKSGNEITARRLIVEAAAKADAAHRSVPEIWRRNAALAVRAGEWEPAWRYLQRYLQETGRPLSF